MLKQLSGMDSMFLYAESHRAPLEVGCLQVYDPSTAPRGEVRFKEILATFQDRLDRAAVFTQKLVEVPLSLDHPYWVQDEEFDLEYHVRHISLPKPGDWQQLMAQISRLQARQLDHSKPLWMAHIIEGLDNVEGIPKGCFAMFMKIHHSAIDGVTGQSVQAAMHDMKPYQADASNYQPSSGLGKNGDPGPWNLLARAPFNTAWKTTKLGLGLAQALPGAIQAGIASRKKGKRTIPMTVFNNGRVSPNRVINGCFFALDDFKQIRSAVPAVKINDIALAVISGAMRYYLDARDGLPEESLLAACPINVGTEDDANNGRANLLSIMTPRLHTEIADPLERLLTIHGATDETKDVVRKIGTRTMTEIPMNLPAPIAKNLYPLLSTLALRSESIPYNTMITNVIVKHSPLYLAGARLIRVLATGPIIDQSGIFHTVFSFDGVLSIGFTACREMLPDPQFYTECIQASFDDLKKAAAEKKKVTGKKAAKKKAAKKKTKARKTTGENVTAKAKPESARKTTGADKTAKPKLEKAGKTADKNVTTQSKPKTAKKVTADDTTAKSKSGKAKKTATKKAAAKKSAAKKRGAKAAAQPVKEVTAPRVTAVQPVEDTSTSALSADRPLKETSIPETSITEAANGAADISSASRAG